LSGLPEQQAIPEATSGVVRKRRTATGFGATLIEGLLIVLLLLGVSYFSYVSYGSENWRASERFAVAQFYFVPIILASAWFGDWGAMLTAAAASLLSVLVPRYAVVVQGMSFSILPPVTVSVMRTGFFFLIGLVTASLSTHLANRARQFETLYEVAAAVASTLRPEEVLAGISRSAAMLLGAAGASLHFLSEDSRELVLQTYYGVEPGCCGGDRLSVEESPLDSRALQEGQVLARANPRRGEAHLPSWAEAYGVKAVLVTPLRSKDTTMGLFRVYSGDEGLFTEDVRELVDTFARQAAVAIENARLYDNIRAGYFQTVRALTLAIEAKDPPTLGHSERVTANLAKTARLLGYSGDELELLTFGGILHDIGKIGTGDSRPGASSEEERIVTEMHPLIGRSILQPVAFLRPVLPMIVYHHERLDGSGYPEGLKGEEIPIGARILAVADVYDILTSEMTNSGLQLTHEEAISYLRDKAGTLFDAKVVEAFVDSFAQPPEDLVARLLGALGSGSQG